MAKNPEAVHLAEQLRRSVHGGAWHGAAITDLTADILPVQAVRKPRGGGNSILALVEHLAFWMETAERRLRGTRRRGRADWSEGEGSPAALWQAAQLRLERAEERLRQTLLELDDLDRKVSGHDSTARGLLLGVLQHNAYHGAQIGMLKRGRL